MGALRAAIKDHGPITPEHIGSAAKRIVGNLANASAGRALAEAGGMVPGEARPANLPAIICRCARCGHVWVAAARRVGEAPEVPTSCAGCRSTAWRTRAGTVRRGRPPKKV